MLLYRRVLQNAMKEVSVVSVLDLELKMRPFSRIFFIQS